MTWCTNFKKAIEEETIKLIDWYEEYDHNYTMSAKRKGTPIEKGFYIIDGYATGEMCQKNYPAEPMIPLKYCPYCGATITTEEI